MTRDAATAFSKTMPLPSSPDAAPRELLVAIGVDCDPDRASYPERLTWRGVEALVRLAEIPDVAWTLNVRADTQIRDRCGDAAWCWERYLPIWTAARAAGSLIAWHLHYFDGAGRQDVSEANIRENVAVGAAALGRPDVVHMGWTFQNALSLRLLHEAGVRVDYSPVPRMRSAGRGGVDAYDWGDFAPRPQVREGVRMIPAHSFEHAFLRRRFGTERVMLTITTAPPLYRLLLRDFFRTGADYLVTYFHADELIGGVGGWRDGLYGFHHLARNVATIRAMAARRGYVARFVTVRDLAAHLFDGAAATARRAEEARACA